MNPLKFIHNLFIGEHINNKLIMFSRRGKNEEFFFKENRYIQASDLLLKEIELLVNENVDFNKDKEKIQSLLKIFREIEYNLDSRNSFATDIKRLFEKDVSNISSSEEKYSEQLIFQLNVLEKINKFQNLLSDIRERKSQVDKRVKELGTNFCY
jgi:hypothetical protein